MNNNRIKPEWIPSAYGEIDGPEKAADTTKDQVKPALYHRKAIKAKRGLIRKASRS